MFVYAAAAAAAATGDTPDLGHMPLSGGGPGPARAVTAVGGGPPGRPLPVRCAAGDLEPPVARLT